MSKRSSQRRVRSRSKQGNSPALKPKSPSSGWKTLRKSHESFLNCQPLMDYTKYKKELTFLYIKQNKLWKKFGIKFHKVNKIIF